MYEMFAETQKDVSFTKKLNKACKVFNISNQVLFLVSQIIWAKIGISCWKLNG